MPKNALVLAIDQGTTGTTAVLVDSRGRILKRAYREITQHYPQPGWVEHDPGEIWRSVRDAVTELSNGGALPVAAAGITNQRETTVVWNRRTGTPLGRAVVWQCRRTEDLCRELQPHADLFRQRTGLPVDPYFSGTKLRWILDHHEAVDPGDLCFGTVDTWLIWNLTGGRVHATDFTNASRTLLYAIEGKRWDPDLCRLLGVPAVMLPEVKGSIDDFGVIRALSPLEGVPIRGVAGDQQAALFGQAGFERGGAKNTYGTGCFLLMQTAEEPIRSQKGLVTTLAVDGSGGPSYALEGSIFIGGAALQWLRDEVRLIKDSAESEQAAQAVPDSGGAYLVPAFVGLGAPHWDMQARGILTGLTRGTNRNHIIRAALESMAYQSRDVLTVMEVESRITVDELAVDGGAAANDFLMQFQADILDKPVVRPAVIESTSLGAAFLAGLGAGVWNSTEDVKKIRQVERRFAPAMDRKRRARCLEGWNRALRQAMTR